MNTRGQVNVGMIIVVAVSLIVGAILLTAVAQQVGESTNTVAIENRSLDTIAAGTAQYLTDIKSISDVKIFNATGDVEVPSSNYTVTNNVIDPTTGGLCVNVTPIVTGLNNTWSGAWTIDGTAQPLGYVTDSGGRAVAGLIVILFALAIAVIALSPTIRSGILQMMGR